MALWRLYYHLIWATKERQPLIAPERETQLYGYIIGKADKLVQLGGNKPTITNLEKITICSC